MTGPHNFSAMLDTIRVAMHLFAIGQNSQETWKVLAAVRTEFETFGRLLESVQGHLQKSMSKLDDMSGTRTRAIERALRNVGKLSISESKEVLGLPNSSGVEENAEQKNSDESS